MVINEIYEVTSEFLYEKIEGFVEFDREMKRTEKSWCREGWNTRSKPFHAQKYTKKISWHRIRSRCF